MGMSMMNANYQKIGPLQAPEPQRAQFGIGIDAAAGSTTNPIAERERQIPEELGMLNDAVNLLDEAVGHLAYRLQPVLNESDDPSGEGCLDSYRVPLAGDIRMQRRRVQAATQRLIKLLRELELP